MEKLSWRFFDRCEEPKKIIDSIEVIGNVLIYLGFIAMWCISINAAFLVILVILWILGIILILIANSLSVEYDEWLKS